MERGNEEDYYLLELISRLVPRPSNGEIGSDWLDERSQYAADRYQAGIEDPFTERDLKPPTLPEGARGRGHLIPQRIPGGGAMRTDPMGWNWNQRFVYLDDGIGSAQPAPNEGAPPVGIGRYGTGGGYMAPTR